MSALQRNGATSFARNLLAGLSLAALMAAGIGAAPPSPAEAQSFLPAPSSDPDGEYGEGLDPFDADGPLVAVISTGSQQIRVFDRNGTVAVSKVSTGRQGYETPEGVFSIIQRKVEHNSNLYDDASMPFMQRITWTGVALHEGVVPGYRASHGCIRLPSGFAERLFRTTRMATRVVIVPHDGVPLPITHAALFQPGAPPALPAAATAGDDAAPRADAAEAVVDAAGGQPMRLGGDLETSADTAASPSPAAPVAAPAPPEPTLAELRARRVVAERKLAEATRAVNQAKVGVRPRMVAQGRAERALRQAIVLANRAEGRASALGDAVFAEATRAAADDAMAAHIEALIEHVQLEAREEAARKDAEEKAAAAQIVLAHVKQLDETRKTAQTEAAIIARKLAPVTIFVSRQTGRVYVRQSFREVMDIPVTIREPDRSIGTHVFTAFADGNEADAVTWLGLTIEGPGGASPSGLENGRKRGRQDQRVAAAAAATQNALKMARDALDRVELPPSVLARVMPTLQPGSTLIVSDLGPSIETGPGTDIVVQTKGEAQAARSIANFAARRRSEAANASAWRRERGWAGGSRYWYRW